MFEVKVPLWARVLGGCRAWVRNQLYVRREKRKLTLVCTMISWREHQTNRQLERLNYTLLERGDGKRMYRFAASRAFLKDFEKSSSTYVDYVQPWLFGQMSNEEAKRIADLLLKVPEQHGH